MRLVSVYIVLSANLLPSRNATKPDIFSLIFRPANARVVISFFLSINVTFAHGRKVEADLSRCSFAPLAA